MAAYAKDLVAGTLDELKLREAGFSTNQAREFASTYQVVDQHTDVTGLSATVFADHITGETFLAIRGTELTDPGDLFAGLSIAVFGSAVLQPQYASLKAQVAAWLNDETLSPTFTVTGHSLGGFLATGLNRPGF
ncbi:hypothetical protein ABHF54_05795 [Nitrosomonas europaea]|uniref:hypothetical protein n=1 Tax=Nitrosomonas europaea TaxID=915 RepID=UPI003267C0D6